MIDIDYVFKNHDHCIQWGGVCSDYGCSYVVPYIVEEYDEGIFSTYEYYFCIWYDEVVRNES